MTSTKKLSIETTERIVKLVQEGNSHWSLVKTLIVPYYPCINFGTNRKDMGWLKKENIRVDHCGARLSWYYECTVPNMKCVTP